MVLLASAEASASGKALVRVTVIGGGSRTDLALPAAVPVVTMIPDLTRCLGMEATESHLVVTPSGEVLDAKVGLRGQGVTDGALLTLAPVREYVPPEVHDDVVEAVHGLSRDSFKPWGRRSAELAADVASAWLFLLGAVVLGAVGTLQPREALLAGVVAGTAALGLLICAARATARGSAPRQAWRAVAIVWCACLYAALAGALVAQPSLALPAQPLFSPALWAAVAALGTALVGLVLLRERRLLVAPVVVVAAVVVASGLLERAGLVVAEHCMIVVATVWVLAARAAPGLAMEATALRGQGTARGGPGSPSPGSGIDAVRLRGDLLVSHDMVLGVSLSGVWLLLVAMPSAMATGLLGLLWAAALCAVIALRLRRVRLHAHVVAGLGGVGVLATAAVLGSLALPSTLLVIVASGILGAGLLVGLTAGGVASLHAGWLGDRVEVLLTAAAVPLGLLVMWPTLVPGG